LHFDGTGFAAGLFRFAALAKAQTHMVYYRCDRGYFGCIGSLAFLEEWSLFHRMRNTLVRLGGIIQEKVKKHPCEPYKEVNRHCCDTLSREAAV